LWGGNNIKRKRIAISGKGDRNNSVRARVLLVELAFRTLPPQAQTLTSLEGLL